MNTSQNNMELNELDLMATVVNRETGQPVPGSTRRLVTEYKKTYYFPTENHPQNTTFSVPGNVLPAYVVYSTTRYWVF